MPSDLERMVEFRTGGSLPPLFCVHAVSGSAYAYAGLARLLGPDQPVFGFEAPGFDNERTPVASLPKLADEYTATLREFARSRFGVDGDYCLLGWSLGGALVFEMARRLIAAGVTVSNVILIDAGIPEVLPLPPEREILRRFINDIMGRPDESPDIVDAIFEGQPADASPTAVFAEVERCHILPVELDNEVLSDQYAVFRALLAAFYSMQMSGHYDGPATHVLASESPAEELDWSELLTDLTVTTVHGSHHSIWAGENLTELATAVQRSLRGGLVHVD